MKKDILQSRNFKTSAGFLQQELQEEFLYLAESL